MFVFCKVLLKLSTQQGLVVLPKSLDEQHIKDNLDVHDFALTESELNDLKSLGKSLPNGHLRFAGTWELGQ